MVGSGGSESPSFQKQPGQNQLPRAKRQFSLPRERVTAEGTRELLNSIVTTEADREDVVRDRAIIATMTYSFARVSVTCGLDIGDYFLAGHRRKLHLEEKGGKERTVLVHHKLEEYLSAYLKEASLRGQKDEPLFQSLNRSREMTGRRLLSDNALQRSSAGQSMRGSIPTR